MPKEAKDRKRTLGAGPLGNTMIRPELPDLHRGEDTQLLGLILWPRRATLGFIQVVLYRPYTSGLQLIPPFALSSTLAPPCRTLSRSWRKHKQTASLRNQRKLPLKAKSLPHMHIPRRDLPI